MAKKQMAKKKPAVKKTVVKEEPVHVDEKVNKVEVSIADTPEFQKALEGMSNKVAELTEGRKKEIEEKILEIEAKDKEIEELKKQLAEKFESKLEEPSDDLYIAVIKSKAGRTVAIQGGIIGNKKDIERIATLHRGEARRLM